VTLWRPERHTFGSNILYLPEGFMVAGTISKIVNSYGSMWGHVRPDREPRQVFFNVGSLIEGVDFSSLAVGDNVEFDEEVDRANGLRAIGMRRHSDATVPE